MRLLSLFVLLIFSSTTWSGEPLRIVTTIKPIRSILSGLLAGTRPPELLVDNQQSPYTVTLSRSKQHTIRDADMVVWVGPELEQFMVKQIEQLGPKTTLFTLLDNEEIKVLQSRWNKGKRDPFLWLDSRNILILTDELFRALIKLDPERRSLYENNRRNLLSRLAELDRRLEYGYRGLKSGIGMAYYDTLQYFEQAYALKIRGVVAESPTTPVSGLSFLQSRAKLKSGDYSCLLTEQQIDPDDLSLLTNEITLNIGLLDSFGSKIDAGEDHYFKLMEQNTATIKQCLKYVDDSIAEEVAKEVIQNSTSNSTTTSYIGGKFMLRDHHGKLFTDQDMLGAFHLVYFGYTFCPDVCPTSLLTISSALNKLGDDAKQIQPYFITVDPARDRPEALNTYVNYFHPTLIGLTGTQSMIDRVARMYHVKYEKVIDESRDPDQYIMDHSSGVFVMAPSGEFITKLAHGISADDMAARIRDVLSKQ